MTSSMEDRDRLLSKLLLQLQTAVLRALFDKSPGSKVWLTTREDCCAFVAGPSRFDISGRRIYVVLGSDDSVLAG